MTCERIELLGLAFDDMDVETVIAQLMARPVDAPFAYIVTPNADHLARLRRIPNLAVVYQAAMLCLLDSQLIAHVAGLLRLPRPRVVTGAALTAGLLERLDGQRVAVIGLRRAEMVFLRIRYPAIDFMHYNPPMGMLEDPVAFRKARDFGAAAGTQFTFIALGSPLQELLAYAIVARRSGTGIGLCIGAALQFRAGFVERAPGWMQRAGLEWLHRLAQEPGRLASRYLWDDPQVLFALASAAWRPRRRK